ncbi:MAG: hypothetical protein IKS35_00205 [Clostridia bacterium]|nr:hypothetical protein [Clostridia bacterium]
MTVRLTSTADTSFAHFSGVRVDGTELTRDVDYTVAEGSSVVTLLPEYLDNLGAGRRHTLTVLFTNGEVQTAFRVRPSLDEFLSAPVTGDECRPGLWIGLIAVSLSAALITVLSGRKKTGSR